MSITGNIILEFISRKLHYTYSFVIQRVTWINCLGFSWKISFHLHKRMFFFSILSQYFLARVYVFLFFICFFCHFTCERFHSRGGLTRGTGESRKTSACAHLGSPTNTC